MMNPTRRCRGTHDRGGPIVLEYVEGHAGSVVTRGLAFIELTVRHALHEKVFRDLDVILIGCLSRLLAQEVPALVGDVSAPLSGLNVLFFAVVGIRLPARQAPLFHGEPSFRLVVEIMSRDELAVRVHGQAVRWTIEHDGIAGADEIIWPV